MSDTSHELGALVRTHQQRLDAVRRSTEQAMRRASLPTVITLATPDSPTDSG